MAGPWDDILSRARARLSIWNAWGGDPTTNDFIAWVGQSVLDRYGVKVVQVKLNDTADAVTRVLAEKTAGRNSGGTVDLIWINGANFAAMKRKGLLFGPFSQELPNYAAGRCDGQADYHDGFLRAGRRHGIALGDGAVRLRP